MLPIGRLLEARKRVFFGWWVVAAAAAINAVAGGTIWYGFTVFFLPVTRDLNISRAYTSLVFSSSRLEGGIAGPIAGWLTDRFGPKVVSFIGAFIAGLGFLLISQAQSFLYFFLIYLLVIGIGINAGFFHSSAAAVNAWFIRRRGTAFSIMAAATSVGGAFLVPVLAFIIGVFNWRVAAIAVGLTLWATCIPLSLLLKRSPESVGLRPDGLPQVAQDAAPSRRVVAEQGRDFGVVEALRTPGFWLLGLGITLRMMVTNAVVVHMVPILVWKGLTEQAAASLVATVAFGVIFSRLALGMAGDRWSKSVVTALGLLVGAGGLLILLNASTLWHLYLYAIAFIVLDGVVPLNWALIGDFFGRKSYATLRGIMGILYSIGVFFSPIYAGRVFDTTQSYQQALLVFTGLLILCALLFATLRKPAPGRVRTGVKGGHTLS